jgi:hypothetical protein
MTQTQLPSPRRPGVVRIGATSGLTRVPPDMTPPWNRVQDHAPEQVYVDIDRGATGWVFVDGHRQPSRCVRVEGWNGYATATRMRLTVRQAKDLRDLLTRALDEGNRWSS